MWSTNNLACINLWSTTYIMKEHKKTFKKAGLLTMKELLFYNPLLTGSELRFAAEDIARFLDNVFRNTYGAKYEDNITRAKAIADMVDVLVQKNSTMEELAETIDDDYNF